MLFLAKVDPLPCYYLFPIVLVKQCSITSYNVEKNIFEFELCLKTSSNCIEIMTHLIYEYICYLSKVDLFVSSKCLLTILYL